MSETAEVPDTFIHTRAGARFQPEALRSALARHRLESRPAAEEGGIDRPPNQTPSNRNVSGDLVEGRIGDLVSLNLRSSLNHLAECLQHVGIPMAIIGFRAFFLIPQADSDSVPAARNEQCNFVLEALLLSQQRKGLVLDQLGKLRNALGLQTEGDTTSKHATSSVMVAKRRGGQSDLVQVIRQEGKKAQSLVPVVQLSLIF